MKKKKKVKNNKGFSLVELIIVITIMAILAGALAPQFIKYVSKSREATDDRNIDLLVTTTNSVLADPDVTPKAGTIVITSTSAATYDSTFDPNFVTAFKAAVGNKYPMSKVHKNHGFTITITGDATNGWTVNCTVTGASATPTPAPTT